MDHLVRRIGILGFSEGNGHPFSFSAIINGFSDTGMGASGWDGIYDYLRQRDASEFGIGDMKVTHAWTQYPEVTRKICDASKIPNGVSEPGHMLGNIDAVIIARDDYESHLPLALPFLKAGLPVFIDKPLTLDLEELRTFRPYLESGMLMSGSAMRYARELDPLRISIPDFGTIKLVRGAIVASWEKYGIHLLEAIFALLNPDPLCVLPTGAAHDSVALLIRDGSVIQIDCLGAAPRTFSIEIFGENQRGAVEITDNFSMFRRALWHFHDSIQSGTPAIDPAQTILLMRILMAGRMAMNENRKVMLDEFQI
jgi:predicted dehydrogenase